MASSLAHADSDWQIHQNCYDTIRRLTLTRKYYFGKVAVQPIKDKFMSHTTKTIINRQWHIIDLLTKTNHYLSTEDIKQYLQSKDIAAELLTIQRDLNDLKEIFPLECRTDDKPYGWRWARIKDNKKQELTLVQALAFRLIETQLQGHLPSELMDELEPLFIKARFMLMDHSWLAGGNGVLLQDLVNSLPRPMSDRERHFFERRDKPMVNKPTIFNTLMDKIQNHQEHKQQAKLIKRLEGELKKLGLEELAGVINR